jgi:glycosyltransferase involved in cell wall biosynthesis
VRRCWNRDARIIYPPVDTEYFRSAGAGVTADLDLPAGFLLGLGRWIPYKNMTTVIEVGERTGRPVVIAGSGPQRDQLTALAARSKVPVTLVPSPSQELVRELYRGAHALIFPTVEDFGMVPVEAQACGTPVIAPARGGTVDTVVSGRTGVLVEDFSVGAYAAAVDLVERLNPADCRLQAERFSYANFHAALDRWLADVVVADKL